jgi:predicted amidophosphoribosyltransferase
MRCPHCQEPHREGARFCAACGHPLARICTACGNQPPHGAAFRDHCGTPPAESVPTAIPRLVHRLQTPQAYTPTHLAEKIIHSRAALEGERK